MTIESSPHVNGARQNPAQPESYQAICDIFEAAVANELTELSPPDGCIAALSAAAASRHWDRLADLAEAALSQNLDAEAVLEVGLQTTIYTGVAAFPKTLEAIEKGLGGAGAAAVFSGNPIADLEKTALDLRCHLHGERHRLGHADPANSFSGPLYEITARCGYGLIWSRPGLTIRQRLICAVATLSVTGPPDVLRKFILTALAHGLTAVQIRAAVDQTVIFQGSPRTLRALLTIEDTLAEKANSSPEKPEPFDADRDHELGRDR